MILWCSRHGHPIFFFFFRISVPRATSIGVQVGKVILGQKIWPFFFLLFSRFDQLLTETPLLPYGGGDGDVINTRLLQLVTFLRFYVGHCPVFLSFEIGILLE